MAVGRLARCQLGLLQGRLQGRLLRAPFAMRADGRITARDLRFVTQAALFDQLAQTLARRILVLHALFDARDFGLRLIVSRLLHIQCVLPGKMRLSCAFQRGFDLTQPRGFGFESRLRIVELACDTVALRFGVALFGVPQSVLRQGQFGVQIAVLLGDFGLRGEFFELVFEFALNVVDAIQIGARVFQARFSFLPALFVLGHAGGFFQITP